MRWELTVLHSGNYHDNVTEHLSQWQSRKVIWFDLRSLQHAYSQCHTTMKWHLEYWLIVALMHFLSFIPFPFVLVLLFCIIPIANTEPKNNPSHHIECKCMFSSSALPLNWWKKYNVSLWFSPPKRVSRTLTKMVNILVLILWQTYCWEQGYIKFHSLVCCPRCFQLLS